VWSNTAWTCLIRAARKTRDHQPTADAKANKKPEKYLKNDGKSIRFAKRISSLTTMIA